LPAPPEPDDYWDGLPPSMRPPEWVPRLQRRVRSAQLGCICAALGLLGPAIVLRLIHRRAPFWAWLVAAITLLLAMAVRILPEMIIFFGWDPRSRFSLRTLVLINFWAAAVIALIVKGEDIRSGAARLGSFLLLMATTVAVLLSGLADRLRTERLIRERWKKDLAEGAAAPPPPPEEPGPE